MDTRHFQQITQNISGKNLYNYISSFNNSHRSNTNSFDMAYLYLKPPMSNCKLSNLDLLHFHLQANTI